MAYGFLSYQIGEKHDILFNLPINSWLKAHLPDLICFDLDNHSDRFLTDHVLIQLKETDKMAVYLVGHQTLEEAGSILRILSSLKRSGVDMLVITKGTFNSFKKIESLFAKYNFFSDINYEEQQNIILKFFNK